MSFVWSENGPCRGSPLLVCEQLVSLQPGRDPGVTGQVVLGTGCLQRADLGQHLKLLQGKDR